MPRLLPSVLFITLVATAGTAAARFEVLGDLSAPGVAARRVVVYLPNAYDLEPARRFPVLYVHDGQSAWRGGYEIDRAVESLAAARRIEPHLVVAIDATGDRGRDLVPAFSRARPARPSLERYAELLIDVVKPAVDARYRTRPGREDTAVLGYSLGGLAGIFLARWHGDVFGRIACTSPSIWRRREEAIQATRELRARRPVRLWIDAGSDEGRARRGIPEFVADIRRLRDAAIAGGMVWGRDLGYREVAGAYHAESQLGERIETVLSFLLAGVETAGADTLALRPFHETMPVRARAPLALEVARGPQRLTVPAAQVTWRVRDPAAADIDAAGVLHARRAGSVEVEAAWQGHTARATVVVF